MAMEALAPFANYACPPGSGLCACHNCTARTVLSAARSYLASPVAQSDAVNARRYEWLRDRRTLDQWIDAAMKEDASLRSQPDTGNPAASPVDGKTASTEGVPGAICRCPIKGMHDASYGPCPLNLQRYPTDGVRASLNDQQEADRG
jgi:hypothetical protein